MNDININSIQGKQLQVTKMNWSNSELEATLEIEFLLENDIIAHHIIFYNVNSLAVDVPFSSFCISGFEIIDNRERGWDTPSRYYVHDFEDESIKFYCEKFEIK